jgi:hypothetical protein
VNLGLYEWTRRFRRDGLTPSARLELRDLLTPRVVLRPPFLPHEGDEQGSQVRIKDVVNWEIVLTADDVHTVLRELNKEPRWREALPNVLSDATGLLHEALDLMRELEGANDRSDQSYFVQPSISAHPQNRDFRDWTALIDITRDAWLATAATSASRAQLEVERWQTISYPLFRRLTFFAATEPHLFSSEQALNWLLSDERHWLWSTETQREAIRLLVTLAPKLAPEQRNYFFQAILAGPPRDMFRDDTDPELFQRIADREIWLRLSKCRAAGTVLPPDEARKLAALSAQYSGWRLPVWMGVGEGEEWRTFQATPKHRRELEAWLRDNRESDLSRGDDWRERCNVDFPRTAIALVSLAKQGEWPTDRWRTALQVWSEETRVARSWRYLRNTLLHAPDPILTSLAHPLSWLLQSLGKAIQRHEAEFFDLIGRLLKLLQIEPYESHSDIIFKAINHPVGLLTDATFRWWYRQKLQDGQGLNAVIERIFTQIADVRIAVFRHGRVLLGANLVALFRVDRKWTEENLLPLFNWERTDGEARAVWTGFLWSPRLYEPLLEALKSFFLATPAHYHDLGEGGTQYVVLLTFAGLEGISAISRKELAEATSRLPVQGLEHMAHTLVQALESAGEQRAQYWQNRILPYVQFIWPKSKDARTPIIEENFARLCIAAGDKFPDAFAKLKHWLAPLKTPDMIIHSFHEAKLSERHPLASLEFLDLVTADTSFLAFAHELLECLDAVRRARPETATDQRFQNLLTSVRRRGGA